MNGVGFHSAEYPEWLLVEMERKPRKPSKKTRAFLRQSSVQCAYCERQILSPKEATWDHVIPVSKGGNGNYINRVWCCRSCNGKKGNNSLTTWLSTVKRKIKQLSNPSAHAGHRYYYLKIKHSLETKWIPYVEQNQQQMVKHVKVRTRGADNNDNFY